MILIFFNKFRHKNKMVKRVKQSQNILEYTILKTSKNIFENVQVSREPRSNTKLCTSVEITISKRHGPGKEAGKVVMGAGENFANPFCRGAQCGIRPTVIATNKPYNDTSNNAINNNRNVPQTNSSMQHRNFNDQHARQHDARLMGRNFNSLVEQINRSFLEGSQESTTTSVTTEQEATTTKEIHQRLYQEAVTPLQNNISKEYPIPPKEHQVNMAKLNDEFKDIQTKQQSSENNSDGSIKPSTIKGLINNTKEPLTLQENNFRNNTDISQTESLSVPVTTESDITSLPFVPPLLPPTGIDTTSNNTTVDNASDVKMDFIAIKDSENLQGSHIPIPAELIDNLIKHDLMTIENNETKLTQKFFDLLQKDLETIKISGFDISMPFHLELGLLEVTKEKEKNTIFLDGKQNHVVVMCILQNTTRLAFSMLTSTKNGTTLLSNYQPFNLDDDKTIPKKQYLATFENPLLIKDNTYYKLLDSSDIYKDDVTQRELGQSYINKPEIFKIVLDNFLKKTLKKIEADQGHINVYNGEGITMDDIKNVRQKNDLESIQNVKQHFQKYIEVKNLLDEKKLKKTLNNIQKKADKKTWELLQQKIHEDENKNK